MRLMIPENSLFQTPQQLFIIVSLIVLVFLVAILRQLSFKRTPQQLPPAFAIQIPSVEAFQIRKVDSLSKLNCKTSRSQVD